MDNTPDKAAGEAPASQTEATPINSEPQQPAVNMYGFTEEQLADMRKFYDSQGGYEKVKSRISNPQNYAEQQQPAQPTQPIQSTQPTQPVQEQPAFQPQSQQPVQSEVPKGYAKPQELLLEQYFDRLSARPEYANISKDIANGNILKEMSAMGMNPIDDNFNVNTAQLEQFLKLKSASVPAIPTETAPTNIPTVDFTEVGENITDVNQALKVLEESRIAKSKGLAEHPSVAKAEEFLRKAWGGK